MKAVFVIAILAVALQAVLAAEQEKVENDVGHWKKDYEHYPKKYYYAKDHYKYYPKKYHYPKEKYHPDTCLEEAKWYHKTYIHPTCYYLYVDDVKVGKVCVKYYPYYFKLKFVFFDGYKAIKIKALASIDEHDEHYQVDKHFKHAVSYYDAKISLATIDAPCCLEDIYFKFFVVVEYYKIFEKKVFVPYKYSYGYKKHGYGYKYGYKYGDKYGYKYGHKYDDKYDDKFDDDDHSSRRDAVTADNQLANLADRTYYKKDHYYKKGYYKIVKEKKLVTADIYILKEIKFHCH
mmetsp:Transcript_12987/g.39974  ORF Transcript_12987/g.39974 Transcript_12987/m.39974 type:complete len:290 (+) Transcript_12987:189-1058(+)